jgi:adenine-specific DNA-methyltransferase
MSRTKKDTEVRRAMCARFVSAMNELNLSPLELSRALGYSNAATITKVQRGDAFVDTERLHIFAKLRTPEGKNIDLNWLISGTKSIQEPRMSLAQSIPPYEVMTATATERTGTKPSLANSEFKLEAALCSGEQATGNRLIHGDNLEVLSALADEIPNSVRCAYLDPPYNNGESYLHYFDSMGHEEWLEAVTKRLRLIKKLLRSDGCVWISIDDSELHYLKVSADGVFGRDNFVGTVIWERRTTRENRKVLSRNHEYLLLYAKNAPTWTKSRNSLPLNAEVKERYKNPDNDPRGPWQSVSANVQDGHATPQQFYDLKAPNGKVHWPPKGRCWVYAEDKMNDEIRSNNIWFGKDGNGVPRIKKFLAERKDGLTPETLWRAEEVGTTSDAKKQLHALFKEISLFDTPKPEQLISKLLHISTNPGDMVLDPYLGSGTTAAVAHKMGRRYIGIENGEHIKSHCAFRLRQVIDGDDVGISAELEWKGGGGFEFYTYQQKGSSKN